MVFPCPPWRTLGARGDLLRCRPDAGSRADESLPAGAGPNDVATRLDAASGRPWATGHDVTGSGRYSWRAIPRASCAPPAGSRSAHIRANGVYQQDPSRPGSHVRIFGSMRASAQGPLPCSMRSSTPASAGRPQKAAGAGGLTGSPALGAADFEAGRDGRPYTWANGICATGRAPLRRCSRRCIKRQVRHGDPRWQWARFGDPLWKRARKLVTERGCVTGDHTDPPSGAVSGIPGVRRHGPQMGRPGVQRSFAAGLNVYRTCRIADVARVHTHARTSMIIHCSAHPLDVSDQARHPIRERPDRRLLIVRVIDRGSLLTKRYFQFWRGHCRHGTTVFTADR